MKKAFVVLNREAGDYHAGVQQTVEQHFAGAAWATEIHVATGERDITAVVREALRPTIDRVVAAGGDGTVSAVAGALARRSTPLGIIPLGTGNVLARDLEIPLDVDEALNLLTGEHAFRRIDGMQVGERFFVLNVGVGLSSLMMRGTDYDYKRWFGRLAYLWTGLSKLLGYQPHHFDVEIDGRVEHLRASEVMIANSGAIGNASLRWRPRVRLDDGRLDVCILRARTVFDYVGVAWNVVWGRQREDPNIRCHIAKRSVSIDSRPALPVQGDGEFIGWPPVDVAVVPNAVRVVVPRAKERDGPVELLQDLLIASNTA